MKPWRETDCPAVEGKWECGRSTHGKAAGGRAVSQSDAQGGNTSSLRGHVRDSGCTAWRARASGEQHSHHRCRPKGQGAQLLDRGVGTAVHILETSAAWGPPARPREHTRKPPAGNRWRLCYAEQEHGARSRARVREVNGTQGTAGAEGEGPGRRARKPQRFSRGGTRDSLPGLCKRAGSPTATVDQTPSSPRRAGGRRGREDSRTAAGLRQSAPALPNGHGGRAPGCPVPSQ